MLSPLTPFLGASPLAHARVFRRQRITLRLFTIAVTFLVFAYSTAYCADFAQVGTVMKTAMPAESPVKVLEDKRHVLCEKCPTQTKLNPIIVASQAPGVVIKVGSHIEKPIEEKSTIQTQRR